MPAQPSGKSQAELSATTESETTAQTDKASQAASPSARQSIFLRPDEMEGKASHAEHSRVATAVVGGTTSKVSASTSEASESTVIENVPSIRGGRENPFPVPKTLFDAFLAIFDFRFRTFITPWIVKIVWALCVVAATMSAVKLGYDMFLEPSLDAYPTASSSDPGWQFDPLAGQALWQSSSVRFILELLGIGLLLIALRVVCEGAILFFYVANRVNDLQQFAQQREKP